MPSGELAGGRKKYRVFFGWGRASFAMMVTFIVSFGSNVASCGYTREWSVFRVSKFLVLTTFWARRIQIPA